MKRIIPIILAMLLTTTFAQEPPNAVPSPNVNLQTPVESPSASPLVVTSSLHTETSWLTPSDILKHSVAIACAAFGALLGAISAYWLGRWRHKNDERDKYYGHLLAAQYSLMSQWNILEGIRLDFLEPLRNDPNRFSKLPLYYSASHHYPVPFDGIIPLTRSSNPHLLQEIHIAEQRFHSCQESIAMRNKLLEAFYKNPSQGFDSETGRAKIHAEGREVFILRKATDTVYTQVDKTLPTLEDTVKAMEQFIKAEFKGAKALKMQALG